MLKISVNQFRAKIKTFVDSAVSNHEPVLVHRRGNEDFIVVSAEDWDREQETIYVLQNNSLMNQIAESLESYRTNSGHLATEDELNEITGI
ncbi:MAG: type II toxin-antitoxin system Phd/YefM family antitoxin [Candidatus Marinimicrobia bacterium]|nr:type II toxin-antitoxin system Phd/YefM family antitoxin [Candidatus Neomarinimicrobiota bacterium]